MAASSARRNTVKTPAGAGGVRPAGTPAACMGLASYAALFLLASLPAVTAQGDTPPYCHKRRYAWFCGPSAEVLSAGRSTAVEPWIYWPVNIEDETLPGHWTFSHDAEVANDRKLVHALIRRFGVQNKDHPVYFVHGSTWCHDPRDYDFSGGHRGLLWAVSFVDWAQDPFWPTTRATQYELGDSFQMSGSVLERFSNRTVGFFSVWKRTEECAFVFRDTLYGDSIPEGEERVYARTRYDYTNKATQYRWPDSYAFTPRAVRACGLQLEQVYAIRLPLPSELEGNDTSQDSSLSLWEAGRGYEEVAEGVANREVRRPFGIAHALLLLPACALLAFILIKRRRGAETGAQDREEDCELLEDNEDVRLVIDTASVGGRTCGGHGRYSEFVGESRAHA